MSELKTGLATLDSDTKIEFRQCRSVTSSGPALSDVLCYVMQASCFMAITVYILTVTNALFSQIMNNLTYEVSDIRQNRYPVHP